MHSRKGFSLAELLIVVVITAVITSMIMISSRESASTAHAGRIVDSLVNLLMAAMTLYSNSTDHFAKDPDKPANLKPYALRYMYSEIGAHDTDNFYVKNDSGKWWAGYDTENNSDSEEIKQKLTGRAKSSHLKGTANSSPERTLQGL